jgi:hypothetical protein
MKALKLFSLFVFVILTVAGCDEAVPVDVPQIRVNVRVEWTIDGSYNWGLGEVIAPGFIGSVEIRPRNYAEHRNYLETCVSRNACDWHETMSITPESRMLVIHLQQNAGPRDVGIAQFALNELVDTGRICQTDGFRGGTMCVTATRIRTWRF